MSWEYRLVKEKYNNEEIIDIREIYYDKNDSITAYGDAPVPFGESEEEVKECLDLMYRALDKTTLDIKDIVKEINKNN